MNDTSVTISFSPPLPCITWQGDRICGKDATVAHITPTGGGYLMQPICRECTLAMMKNYFPEQAQDSKGDGNQ
jgi:hypothetical protein